MSTETATVIVCLAGPTQTWGTDGYWEHRGSLPRPTKSGVLGMVANALGRDYSDDISDLNALHFTVRADRPGHLQVDEQTAGGGDFPALPQDFANDPVLAASPQSWRYGAPRGPRYDEQGRLLAGWSETNRETVTLQKTYIVDAAFLVGLTGPRSTVDQVAHALEHPHRLLYLGRRNCPPSTPPLVEVTTDPDWAANAPLLPNATEQQPWLWTETLPSAPAAVTSPEGIDTHVRRYRMLPLVQQRQPVAETAQRTHTQT